MWKGTSTRLLACALVLLVAGCQSSRFRTDDQTLRKTEHVEPEPQVAAASTESSVSESIPLWAVSDGALDADHAGSILPVAAESEEIAPPAPEPMTADEIVPPLETDVSTTFHEGTITLAFLEQMALEHNPAIRQASASVAKAQGFRSQVGKLPNPSVGYNGTQLDDAGTDQHTAFVSQDYVTGHKLHLNERVMDQEVQVQLWEVEAQRYRVLTDVRQRFYVALSAQQRLHMATEFQKVVAEGVRIAEDRRRAKEGSTVEVLQSEIQYNEVELIRRTADITYQAAWDELVALIGVPELVQLPLSGNLRMPIVDYRWDEFYYQIIGSSPEVRAACARVGRSQSLMGRQAAQPIPNLGFFLGAGHDNGTGSQLINVQVEMPMPVFNRNQGNISAAFAEYCRTSQELRRLELSLKARLAQCSRDYDTAATTTRLYEAEILPRAKKMLQLAEEAYVAGETSFLEILVSRRIYFDANLQYIDALASLAEANALVDGMLLQGGLDSTPDTDADSSLRDQALSGQ